jgi:hypothetical protein
MPSFSDWLKGSWDDFRRRWAVLLAVVGIGGAAAMAAAFLPLVPAALLSAFGVGPAWAVWGTASLVSVLIVLWMTTWAQASLTRAALTEEPAGACLSWGWAHAGAFGWVLTLALVAAGGGYFLLLLPGLALSVLLFFGGFIQVSGEADGLRALQLSWGRVRPRFGLVSGRILAASVLTAAPGWTPWIGWILMMFWAPFGMAALARLARDLRAADPAPAVPERLGAATAGLAAVFVVGLALSGALAVRAAVGAVRSFNQPGGLAERVRPETAQALLDALSGQASDAQKKKAYDDLWNELRSH